ncbi:YrvL family regulatory protein [Shouchella clausii]|nr:YrvL family regulatory protein [Shouchella clausii]MCY1105516.1 YrvL family regulatory protein [Shouchella clausii]
MHKGSSLLTVCVTVFFIIVISAAVLAFIFGIYYLGMAGLFQLLGIRYDSVQALALFVLLFLLIGIFIELFAKVFNTLLLPAVGSRPLQKILEFCIRYTFTLPVVFLLDHYMSTIHIK